MPYQSYQLTYSKYSEFLNNFVANKARATV